MAELGDLMVLVTIDNVVGLKPYELFDLNIKLSEF